VLRGHDRIDVLRAHDVGGVIALGGAILALNITPLPVETTGEWVQD